MKTTISIIILLTGLAAFASAQDLTTVDFTLRDINGEEKSLQDLLKLVRGSEATPKKGVLMISFWALWCEPCKQEMKALKETYDTYKDKNFHYLAINIDNPRSGAKVKAYVTAQGLPYNFWLDPNSEVFKKLNGSSMPYSLIVTGEGKLIAKRVGFIAGDEKEIAKDIAKNLE
jgi:cytochrome c biogenesis protein CcmG, thiol:disulfide interchange protein DsbE